MSHEPTNPGNTTPPDDRYLWDASGTPDRLVRAFERAGASMRPRRHRLPSRGEVRLPARARFAGMAAALALLVGLAWFWSGRPAGLTPMKGLPAPVVLPSGTLQLSDGGVRVLAGPDASSNRYVLSGSQRLELTLRSGAVVRVAGNAAVVLSTIDSKSPAPPRVEWGRVEVDSIGASAGFDLAVSGATLTVPPGARASFDAQPKASSHLDVAQGWVGWRGASGVERRLWAGITFALDSERTPLRADAPEDLAGALALTDDLRVKNALLAGKWKVDPIEGVARLAEPADAPSLWNLLVELPPERRAPVAARLAEIIGETDAKVVESARTLDPGVLDRWWSRIVELGAGAPGKQQKGK